MFKFMKLSQFLKEHYPKEYEKLKLENPKLFKLSHSLKIRKGNTSLKNCEKFWFSYELYRNKLLGEREFKNILFKFDKCKEVLIRANLAKGEIIYYSFPSFGDIIYVLRKFLEFLRG